MATEQQRERRLAWDGCANTRDLGGYPTRDGRETRWGRVVRSDRLTDLTDPGQAALEAYGVRTIVDLRSPEELAAYPNPYATAGAHAITFVNTPLRDPAAEPTGAFTTMPDAYLELLERFAANVARAMAAITGATEGGVLVHCMAGKDRTGLVCALLLELAGVDRETIAADYALTEECLRDQVEAWLASDPVARAERERDLARYAATAAVMTETLDRLDKRHGGAEAYLLRSGVSAGQIAALRERLLEPGDGGA